jgi:hypothetical protein
MTRTTTLKIAAILATLSLFAIEASAATVRIQCEQRGTSRAKVSVDGNNLPAGTYRAQIMSGNNAAQSGAQAAIGDEVEFDFDSAPADIAQGATAITPNFIQKGQVVGKIVDATGATVISDTVTCRVRR